MIRRVIAWLMRSGGRSAVGSVLRYGQRSAIDTALGAALDAVPRPSQQVHSQVFNVVSPVTVYVRASHCRVKIRRADTRKVTLQAEMQRAFGLELAAEQDDDGVYIVARRKPVTGQLARADFTVTVPHNCHLALHLTPGDVVLQDIDGMLELPPQPSGPEQP